VNRYDVSSKRLLTTPLRDVKNEVGDIAEKSRPMSPRAKTEWPLLPWPRGPLSATVISALQRQPGTLGATPPLGPIDALSDDDFSLALYLCYEQHYRGVANAEWEWDTGLLAFRAELERAFTDRLLDEVRHEGFRHVQNVVVALDELLDASRAPSLSTFLFEDGTLDQLRELCVHRSAYRLREVDPHVFAIPRLSGEAKAAMMEIYYGDLASDDATATHAVLFGDTMAALGLDRSYGSYVEMLPGTTLATVNLVSMFALHRRWLAALVGHLAVLEMTSVESMRRYAEVLTRLGVAPEGRNFYDAHMQVDARRSRIARDRLVGGLVDAQPHLGAELLFGAAAILLMEERFSTRLLESWTNNDSSLVPWELKAC
jgi:hypothetical protein